MPSFSEHVAVWARFASVCLALFGVSIGSALAQTAPSELPSIAEMEDIVAKASAPKPPWAGPTSGPKGQPDKTIALIAEDLRNGGILGVAQGVAEAAQVLNWTIKLFDAGGSPEGRAKAVADALALGPDGVILDGADAGTMKKLLAPFAKRGVPIVGWHVGAKAGPMTDHPVAMNVSSDPLEVARVTAMAAVVAAKGRAGVVIFTDSNFEIALAKSHAMAAVIKACATCELLEVRDVAISQSADIMAKITHELLGRFKERWTHALAINDIYFDYATPELILAGRKAQGIQLLSAGDGSNAAFLRIHAELFQTATVAEPLNVHGWQVVDELNRLLAGEPVSGYVVPVHLITPSNIAYDGGPSFSYDPDNGYRDAYTRIWFP